MNSIVKPYLLRASLFAGLAIIMGLVLSFFVYHSTVKVKQYAVDLVEYRIPILTSINELMADLSEQERIIYEFYRSQNNDVFLSDSEAVKQTFAMHFRVIQAQERFTEQAKIIAQGQQKISELFQEFYHAMQLNIDNWDEMRTILQAISKVRRDLLPTLQFIEQQTQATVEEGHEKTLMQMAIAHWIVIAYSVVIVFVAGLVSWYIRQYMLAQAKNTRLALFSQQNPNPILSVDHLGEVTYANPACGKLLNSVSLDPKKPQLLLPQHFLSYREELIERSDHSLVIEQALVDRILQISLYWHQAIDAYDIHVRDVTEHRLAEIEVNKLAFTHQETQLPNQYRLREKLAELIDEQIHFSLGVVAIRHFDEKVNSLGGEVVLSLVQEFTRVVVNRLPQSVELFHISDNEFALLCTESISTLQLQKLVKRIAIDEIQALATPYGDFFVACDFGFVLYPEHGDEYNSLLKNAHIALSLASKSEHENYVLFQTRFAERVQESAQLIDKLRHAIANQELFLVFQPQLALNKQAIMGVETLVRWRHQESIVSPAEFIPLAETSGLIVPIGQWILEQACLFAKSLVDKGYVDLVVAVNVSPRQFSHPQFSQTIKQALQLSQLPAKNLELEITEGVFMHQESNTKALLHHLKSLGVKLSIDDFGTGYSSLSYLKEFPIDKLKIDQSFIRDCHQNEDDRAIVNTIVSLGKNLGLSIIAEGVEEKQHVDFLASLACDEIQGYWFSRPLPSEQLLSFLKEHQEKQQQKRYAE
ncbi:GGDEF domain-containing phosphodiesterase [Thalassotalea sp. G2M2-11]|uniref:putative bifunctional diguanylate cyclase/phosphodiesterase n=1 Tax=Thalassotalea sp. G2M2-11 TaxID=2787627 RepID=UPI0019D0023C|nr:GGDEF domain-containing phosphodiesterase [Thalassotalea sp. G2M2-11]